MQNTHAYWKFNLTSCNLHNATFRFVSDYEVNPIKRVVNLCINYDAKDSIF